MQVQWEPLIIEKEEWDIIEKGIKQRFLAINKYVKDFYTNDSSIIPKDIMIESKYYNKDLLHFKPNFEFVSNLYGIDLMRSTNGEIYVIEDNFARPGGMQYVIEMRKMLNKFIVEGNANIEDTTDFSSVFYSGL